MITKQPFCYDISHWKDIEIPPRPDILRESDPKIKAVRE